MMNVVSVTLGLTVNNKLTCEMNAETTMLAAFSWFCVCVSHCCCVLWFVLVDYNNISKFLNRILGIEVELQNKLFRYFTDTLASVIVEQKRRGAWDMGILGNHSLTISYTAALSRIQATFFMTQTCIWSR